MHTHARPSKTIRIFRAIVIRTWSIATNPIHYLREATILAMIFGIWWCLAQALDKAAVNHGAGHKVDGQSFKIQQLTDTPEGRICVYRNFSEMIELDGITGEQLAQQRTKLVDKLNFGRDGRGWSYFVSVEQRYLDWWHSEFGQIDLRLPGDYAANADVSLAENGRSAVVLNSCGKAHLYRLTEQGSVEQFNWATSKGANRCSLSPAGHVLAILSDDLKLQFHEASSGVEKSPLIRLPDILIGYAWSLDERAFSAVSEDMKVRVWKLDEPAAPALTIDVKHFSSAVAISRSAEWLIVGTAEGAVQAWQNGRQIWQVQAQSRSVSCLNLTIDQSQIIVGGSDGITRLDLQTGQLINRF